MIDVGIIENIHFTLDSTFLSSICVDVYVLIMRNTNFIVARRAIIRLLKKEFQLRYYKLLRFVEVHVIGVTG